MFMYARLFIVLLNNIDAGLSCVNEKITSFYATNAPKYKKKY